MVRLVQGGVKAPCGAGLGLDRRVAAAVVATPCGGVSAPV